MSNQTVFVKVNFKATDGDNGEAFIVTRESLTDTVDVALLPNPGTTFEETAKIADYLNKNIAKVSVRY